MAHSSLVLAEWDRLMRLVENENGRRGDDDVLVVVDGKSIDLATVVAVAR